MIYLSLFFFSLSFLWPAHFEPLPLFYQNSFIFFSLILLLVKLREIYIDRLTAVFIILLFILVLFEYFINGTISDSSIYFFMATSVCIVSYVLGINYRNNLAKVKLFIPAYLFTAVILFVIQVCQIYHIDSIFIKYILATSNRYYSNIGQPNILATIYATAIACLIFRKNNTKLILLISIFVLGVFLTKSRVGYLSLFLVCSFSFFIVKEFKVKSLIKHSYPMLLLIAMFAINYLNRESFLSANRLNNLDNSRMNIYKDAINLIIDKPILGYGWESAHKYIPNNNVIYFKKTLYSYHNILFDLVLSYGIIITIILFFIFINLVWKNRNKNNAIFFIVAMPFLLHSFVEFPYYYWYFLIPFAFVMGIVNKNYFNEKICVLQKKYILLITLVFLLVYRFFYDEYDLITQGYLSVYNAECREVPKKNWLFFNDSAKHLKYFCLSESNERAKKKIVLNSLKYVLLIDYVDAYELKNDSLKEYACIKYNYACGS